MKQLKNQVQQVQVKPTPGSVIEQPAQPRVLTLEEIKAVAGGVPFVRSTLH